MIFNTGIRIQRKTVKRTRLLSISNSIRENIRSYDKKENKKKSTINYWDTISNKRKRTREPRIKILKEIINISGYQE